MTKSTRWPASASPVLNSPRTRPGSGPMVTSVSRKKSALRELRISSGSRNWGRSEEHTSELQSHVNLVCRLLLEKKKKKKQNRRKNKKKKKKKKKKTTYHKK